MSISRMIAEKLRALAEDETIKGRVLDNEARERRDFAAALNDAADRMEQDLPVSNIKAFSHMVLYFAQQRMNGLHALPADIESLRRAMGPPPESPATEQEAERRKAKAARRQRQERKRA